MRYRLPTPDPGSAARLILVTALRSGLDHHRVAVALAAKAAAGGQPVLLVELRDGRPRPAGIFSTALSRGLVEIARGVRADLEPVARGGFCSLTLPEDVDSARDRIAELIEVLPTEALCLVATPPGSFRALVEGEGLAPDGAVLVAELPRDRAVAALTCRDLNARGLRCRVWGRRLTGVGRLSVDAGFAPPGAAGERASQILARLLASDADREPTKATAAPASAAGAAADPESGWRAKLAQFDSQRGQVTVLMTGLMLVAVLVAVALVVLGGALTGKGRMQRAADLAAVSAVRSLRDDLPRRLSPAVVNGTPNPYHMSRAQFLARARAAARRGAVANGAGLWRLRVRFPDRLSPAPLMAEVRLSGEWRGRRLTTIARAEARIGLGGAGSAATAAISAAAGNGDYSGPLAERQGRRMRPDVAFAFDQMAAAAAAAGHHLVISSAYRSDVEQAALFAANPDPKWVAPPGTSLHRCGTELDLGPVSAYAWLAANAGRWGFAVRYSWEPWHVGYSRPPAPCSAAANSARFKRGDGLVAGAGAAPSYVPRWLAPHLERAAARWGISAPLLAAQLQAESNFDPRAVSSAGAQGIAQFMPGTAAAYGLRDPFDPIQAVAAQAHLMADLLRQFGGSTELALAAYNAGPGAVSACMCVPAYAETRAYVAKIAALLGGDLSGVAGGALPSAFEIRLVS